MSILGHDHWSTGHTTRSLFTVYHGGEINWPQQSLPIPQPPNPSPAFDGLYVL